MEPVTLCTVSFQAADALALMRESWEKHHPDVPYLWFVYDNASTDGAKEYACEHADLVIHGDNSLGHGECLSELCRQVQTPFVLAVDNDIEFRAPVYETLLSGLRPMVYCSCLSRLYPFGFADRFGERYKAQWSPNIAVGLMRTKIVQRILEAGISFGNFFNYQRKEFYETGAMFYRAARACGWQIAELPELWECVTHYGQVSTLWLSESIDPNSAHPDYLPEIRRRYKLVGERLRELRKGKGDG